MYQHNKRINPHDGGVDHSTQPRSIWEKSSYFSEGSIIHREYVNKKGEAPDSFVEREEYKNTYENFLHNERRILKRCLKNLGVSVEKRAYNGNGYSFCLLDAEFCYFLLTSNRKPNLSFFSRLKCGKFLETSEIIQFLDDFSAYLIMQHNCTLKAACEDPAMSKGSFFLHFFNAKK